MTGFPSPANPTAMGATISFDLPCATCEYNLRSLTLDAVCPECGSPTRRSFEQGSLIFADCRWLGSLLKGVRIVLWTLLAAILAFVAFVIVIVVAAAGGPRSGPGPLVIWGGMTLVAVAALIAWIAAVWSLTAPRPGVVVKRRRARPALTWWIIGLSLLPLVGWLAHFVMAGQMIGSDGTPRTFFFIASMASNLVGSTCGFVAILLLLVHVRRIVRHEPKKGLRKMMTFLIWGIVGMVSVGVVCGAIMSFVLTSAFAAPGPPFRTTMGPPAPTGPIVVTAPATGQTPGAVETTGGDSDESGDGQIVAAQGPASQPTTAPVVIARAGAFGPTTTFMVIGVLAVGIQILWLGWCVCALVALFWLHRLFVHSIQQNVGDAFRAATETSPGASPAPPPRSA